MGVSFDDDLRERNCNLFLSLPDLDSKLLGKDRLENLCYM